MSFRTITIACLLFILHLPASRADEHRPEDLAWDYFQALEDNDLDAAEKLFVEPSSVFESGGDEGDWAHYRAHHLGPEIDGVEAFKTTLGKPEEVTSDDDSMAFVAWPIEFHIEFEDGRKIDSRGTVTFVFVRSGGQYRIRHLHWSSRRKQGPPRETGKP